MSPGPSCPPFCCCNLGSLGHWLLARQHQPLWVQCLPYVVNAGLGLWLTRFYIRVSHPALAGMRFRCNLTGAWRHRFSKAVFGFICAALETPSTATPTGLVIRAGFKPGTLSPYEYNYKFCDIAVFVALTASFVSLPKITQWMPSADAGDQQRARTEMRRLNQFQTLLGCGAALAYLAGNNLFMRIWWLHKEIPFRPRAWRCNWRLP